VSLNFFIEWEALIVCSYWELLSVH